MRVIVFVALVISSSFARAGCGDHPVMTTQKEDGTTVGVVITEEQQNNIPKWKPGSGEPPLSVSKAIDAALSWAKKNYKRYDDVQLHSISLSAVGCSSKKDSWYYLAHFSPIIEGNVLFGSGYFAGVLMDGTVIGPTPVKRDF